MIFENLFPEITNLTYEFTGKDKFFHLDARVMARFEFKAHFWIATGPEAMTPSKKYMASDSRA
jgi:hypothetical protein